MDLFLLRNLRPISFLLFLIGIFNLTTSQQLQTKPQTLHILAQYSGCRIVNGEGQLNIELTGTLLVSGLKGTIYPTSSIQLEYNSYDRKVYYGSGKITLKGKFRALQWQGQRLKMDWSGKGKAYAIGEYDPKGKHGVYWYGDSLKKTPLPTNWLNPIVLVKHPINNAANS